MNRAVEPQQPVALQWRVNGLQLAGLSWGNEGDKPLLALHGWLDNAASFAVLAPHLQGYHVVAPDLTGHGKSDRRSADASYQIWDDLPEILGIVEQLGWSSFNLLGHSRGGIIAGLFAGAYPERVRHLVFLDAVSPSPVPESDFPVQLRRGLQDKVRKSKRRERIFATTEDAIATRTERGLTPAAAKLLVERNLRAGAEGYTRTTDTRLRAASAVKLSPGQIEAVLGALTMPALLCVAKGSAYSRLELVDHARRHIEQLVVEEVAGGHHFHMESGAAEVAHCIDTFLQDQRE